MATNGNFKIEIGVTKDGLTIIGSSDIRHYAGLDNLADSEYVYGIQIGHRCAALTSYGWRIMTPTRAKKMGYTEVRDFPAARR